MICSSCGQGCLSPILKSNPYLIIKEQATQNEMDFDTVFTLSGRNKYGHTEHTTSFYLQKEMGLAGLQMGVFNLTNLYMHSLPKNKKSKEDKDLVQGCIDYSIAEVVKLARNMKIVVLSGAEVTKLFTGYNASEIYGLVGKSDYFPEVPVVLAMPNVDKLMSSPIGELRNALKVVKEQVQIYEQYQNI